VRSLADGPIRVPGPFLKWVGGKRQLLPELLARVPAKIDTYYEPFLGGGALFFALAAEGRFKHAVLSDVNDDLIVTYYVVRDDVDSLIEHLRIMEKQHCKDYYYKIRGEKPLKILNRAARFIYLNKTCFNGLHRVNSKGEFNVPMGAYKNPTICDAEGLWAASQALAGVTIGLYDFQLIGAALKVEYAQDDFVYFDPPYVPVSKTSNFTTFSAGGFGWESQERLASFAGLLATRGVLILLSNADTAATRKLYKDHDLKVEGIVARRNINSKAGKRGKVDELLVSSS
jgi:DNA adenine methylase